MTVSYDELPYGGRAIPITHPDRLATEAWLAGIEAAPPERCRVLELGCAEAANLLPMAFYMPGSSFVGVDASREHVTRAVEGRDRLGLDNLRIEHADIATLDPSELGTFDYIIAHGVLSWVAEPVRETILQLCERCLSPNGVAYLSYNTGPGWALRSHVRQALLARTRGAADLDEKLARMRGVIGLLADSPLSETVFGAHLAAEVASMALHRDPYLVHEYLSEHNHVFGYREIVDFAGAHSLEVLAELSSPVPHKSLEEDLRATLLRVTDGDPIEAEELLDLLSGRAFRATLFARSGARPAEHDRDAAERGLQESGWIAGAFRSESQRPSLDPGEHEAFLTPGGARVSAHHSTLKAALLELGGAWPVALRIGDLEGRVRSLLQLRRALDEGADFSEADRTSLREDLARLRQLGHVEVRLRDVDTAVEPGWLPRASTLTRYEAKRGSFVTTPFHQVVEVDPTACALIRSMDGSRDRAALAGELREHLRETGQSVRAEDGSELAEPDAQRAVLHLVERNLAALAVNGLLER